MNRIKIISVFMLLASAAALAGDATWVGNQIIDGNLNVSSNTTLGGDLNMDGNDITNATSINATTGTFSVVTVGGESVATVADMTNFVRIDQANTFITDQEVDGNLTVAGNLNMGNRITKGAYQINEAVLITNGVGDLIIPLGIYQSGGVNLDVKVSGGWAEESYSYRVDLRYGEYVYTKVTQFGGEDDNRLRFYSQVDPLNYNYHYLFADWKNLSPGGASDNSLIFDISMNGGFDEHRVCGDFQQARPCLESSVWHNGDNVAKFSYTNTATEVTITGYSGEPTVVIPDMIDGLPVTTIGENTFYGLAITSLTGGENIRTVGNGAASQCRSLAAISLPAVTSIGEFAYFQCTSLTNVLLPAATSIGTQAFRECTNLTSVCFNGNAPIVEGASIYYGLPAGQVTNYVTKPTATGWGKTFSGMPVVRMAISGDGSGLTIQPQGNLSMGSFTNSL